MSIKQKLLSRLRTYLLTGILVTAPISITIYLTYNFLLWVDDKVTPLIPDHYNPQYYLPFSIPGMGFVLVIVFFIFIGWFFKNLFGHVIMGGWETIVHRLPIINVIYKALKQILETMMMDQSQAFREAVMFEFPRKGIWVIGFVTGIAKGEVQRLTEDEVVNVFFPTTPNPTSGFLVFVPRKDLIVLDMKVDDALKMIISGGILTPPDAGISKPI